MNKAEILYSCYFLAEKVEEIIYNPETTEVERENTIKIAIFLEKLMEEYIL